MFTPDPLSAGGGDFHMHKHVFHAETFGGISNQVVNVIAGLSHALWHLKVCVNIWTTVTLVRTAVYCHKVYQ